MTATRSRKLVGPISILLAGLMLALTVPTSVLPSAEADGQNRLLLLFPVLDRSDSGYEDVSLRATDYLQMALDGVPGLSVTEFSVTSPSVLRAVEDGQIRSVDLEAEITDPVTAIRIGYALNADEVCLATVTSIDTKDEPLRVEVLLNGQCYEVAANVDAQTLQVSERPVAINTFGVSGSSRAREGYAGSLPPLVREALRGAADKAAQVLAGKPAEEMVAEEQESKSLRWVAAALLVAALIIAAQDADDDAPTGPAPDALAPVPVRLEPEPAAIRLIWEEPNTTLTILRYEVQRSTDSGATWNPVPGSQGNVLPGDTSFPDFDVQEGVTYMYRIRARYTTCGPSGWAEFNAVRYPG